MTSLLSAFTAKVAGVETPMEVDYDANCTPLFKAIEQAAHETDQDARTKSYQKVMTFLDTGKWEGSFFNLDDTPEVQAKTWVTRFCPIDKNKVKWSQLPIHLATVTCAPFELIEKLTKLNPQALRCTDDQQMLPLHLALRHGASDEVVAFLAKEFPEAVNAKGKKNRTAVECAKHADDPVRGEILDIFVEKTKSRMSSSVVAERKTLKASIQQKNEQIDILCAELENQRSAVEKINGDLLRARVELESKDSQKETAEADLSQKILDLEQEKTDLEAEWQEKMDKLRNAKLVEALELQKKIEELQSDKKELEEKARKSAEEEAGLRKELDAIHQLVSNAKSTEDWIGLRDEIESLDKNRLEQARHQAKDDIDLLRGMLEETLNESSQSKKPELKDELKTIKTSIDKLQHDGGSSVRTSSDMQALKAEIEQHRQAMKDHSETSKTKVELNALKEAMEEELQKKEGKTKEEIEALKNAIDAANATENKTIEELAAVKEELAAMEKEMKEKALYTAMKKDIKGMKESLKSLSDAHPKRKVELKSMNKRIDTLENSVNESTSIDELITLQKNTELLKDQLKHMEVTIKIQDEATSMRDVVEIELKDSEGATKEELFQLKTTIKEMAKKATEAKDVVESAKVKGDLIRVKSKLADVQQAIKTQRELNMLKQTISTEIVSAQTKTEKELVQVKKAVDKAKLEQTERKNLKTVLTEEIQAANEKMEQELLQMKKSVEAINTKDLESKNKSEWEMIRKEMESLKLDLKQMQSATSNETDHEVAAMKKVIDAIKIGKSKSADKIGILNQEVGALKAEIRHKEIGVEALKRELLSLRHMDEAQSPSARKKINVKKGFKKFFSRGSSRKAEGPIILPRPAVKEEPPAADASVTPSLTDASVQLPPIPTILPPCLSNDEKTVDCVSSTESSEKETNEKEKAAPPVEKEEDKEELVVGRKEEMPKFKQREPLDITTAVAFTSNMDVLTPTSKLRKVQSTHPRIESAYNFNRTISETVTDKGEVELETMEGGVNTAS